MVFFDIIRVHNVNMLLAKNIYDSDSDSDSFLTLLLHTCSMVWALGRCCGIISFLYWFPGIIYWWMIKFSKGMGISKRGRFKYQVGSLFFLFYQSKLMSHFVPVVLAIHLKRCLG